MLRISAPRSRFFALGSLLALLLLAPGALLAQELPIATPVDPATLTVPAAPGLPPTALVITVLVPLIIAGLKKLFPQLPSGSLPVIAPILGGLLEYGLSQLGQGAGGTLAGAVAGGAGVGLRGFVKHNFGKAPPAAALLLLLPCLLLTPGCLSRTMKRYDPETGQLWSTEKFSVVLMRGEASKLREQVKETATGDYERDVSIGTLKGETETDKLKDLAGEVVDRAVSAGVKAAKP
jgi:hypothetical protein